MPDIPRQKLLEIISRFGIEVSENPKRCQSLLRDFCGNEHKKEVTILVWAIHEGVPQELRNFQGTMPHRILVNRCTQRLSNNTGVLPELARWGVETWGYALGVLQPKDLEQSDYEQGANTARRGQPPTFASDSMVINSIGMKLVLIPKGTFMMGKAFWLASWLASSLFKAGQHQVTISKDYYLGVTEVTQGQYKKVMGNNPSEFQGGRFKGVGLNHPVENVSWKDAVEFCRKLSMWPEEKKAGRVYRLPTEAEWEYACRAGSQTAFHFGDDPGSLGDYAWFRDNSGGQTHPVGQKKPNAWGLYDMHGNVWEWCSDWYGDYPRGAVTDPIGPTIGPREGSDRRVSRGGSWGSEAASCRSADRYWFYPSYRYNNYGFRVALSSSGILR
jgi:formylglycine-generating enzyme required for sulfatase activity